MRPHNLWGLFGIREFCMGLWYYMGNYGILWGVMGLYMGILWDFVGLYGIIWDYMGFYGILWDYMGLYGIIWDDVGLRGIMWDYMGLYGIIWDFVGFCGVIWGCCAGGSAAPQLVGFPWDWGRLMGFCCHCTPYHHH